MEKYWGIHLQRGGATGKFPHKVGGSWGIWRKLGEIGGSGTYGTIAETIGTF